MRCVLCALRFSRFVSTIPLEIVSEAGPKESLHNYLHSEKLSWSQMRMDPAGIPRARGQLTRNVYKPAYIAWWSEPQK